MFWKISFFATVLISNALATVVVTNEEGDMVLEISERGCNISHRYTKNIILDLLRENVISNEDFHDLYMHCANTQSYYRSGFIFPGTKWCGAGNAAANYSDLGSHRDIDMCCRTHDYCPKYILSGECIRGTCNNSKYVRSHCDCDLKFQQCLRDLKNPVANLIGSIFFNMMQLVCYKEKNGCEETREKEYICDVEFFEAPPYTVGPIKILWINKKWKFFNQFLNLVGWL